MDIVNIYTATSIRTPKRRDGYIAYVLEYPIEPTPATLSKIAPVQQMTEHQAGLTVIIQALKRMCKKCHLMIYTDSEYVAAAFKQGWIEQWIVRDWKTLAGKEVANRAEWENLLNLLGGNVFEFKVKEQHPYKEWMQRELEREERKHV